MIRYALIHTDDVEAVKAYMPHNYAVLWHGEGPAACDNSYPIGKCVVIKGTDNAGWTLDDYVLPRLASGLYFGQEIDLSHPIMKNIPA